MNAPISGPGVGREGQEEAQERQTFAGAIENISRDYPCTSIN